MRVTAAVETFKEMEKDNFSSALLYLYWFDDVLLSFMAGTNSLIDERMRIARKNYLNSLNI